MVPNDELTNFVHFTNCRLAVLHPVDDESNQDSDGLRRMDLLVDADGGVIAAILDPDTCTEDIAVAPHRRRHQHPEPDERGDHGAIGIRVDKVDCGGNILSPGFIDLQINGYLGVDFSDAATITADRVKMVAKRIVSTGVTSFSPTLISSSPEEYSRILPVLGPLCGGNGGGDCGSANVLGLHLEGPFFAPSKAGAHPKQHIRDPLEGMKSVQETYGTANLREDLGVATVTLAPERDGAMEVIQTLSKQGLVVSMGHTDASLQDGQEAMARGATLITHMFNAMKPFHHREPALLGLVAEQSGGRIHVGDVNSCEKRLYFSIIADGIHAHATAVRLAHSLCPDRAVLITDAMCAMGLGDGEHSLGDTHVVVRGMEATVAGTDILAGSVASMDFCIQSYKEHTYCTTQEALKAATLHPAEVLGIQSKKGRIKIGADADLVLLDDALHVLNTWVGGRKAY
jgi:N-acetylglucosamine-6-phosphate deacetylase